MNAVRTIRFLFDFSEKLNRSAHRDPEHASVYHGYARQIFEAAQTMEAIVSDLLTRLTTIGDKVEALIAELTALRAESATPEVTAQITRIEKLLGITTVPSAVEDTGTVVEPEANG